MPPLLIITAGALGVAALARFLARESRRVNAELDAARAATDMEVGSGAARSTLRRDPATGEYRPREP